MLRSEPLHFEYTSGTALDFPGFELVAGEHLLILGASGSGKSTWLQLLSGIRKPKTGNIYYGTRALNVLKGSALDQFRNQHIGIIFQEHAFIPSLSARENLMLSTPDIPALENKAKALGLHHLLNKKPQHLSVGERQRLAILRCLLRKPQVILADEPSSSLDDIHCERVIQLLLDEAKKLNASLIVVTHDARVKPFLKGDSKDDTPLHCMEKPTLPLE
ncbi:MAG: ATP-binding cassette domain-containing protein [Bacteroidetes bacterium]|nr:ATP-binding cassette domain-containing protein [Bacteroidota bacterium]